MKKALLVILTIAALVHCSLFLDLVAADQPTITVHPATELPRYGILKTHFGFNFAGVDAWIPNSEISGYGNTLEICRLTMALDLKRSPQFLQDYFRSLLIDVDNLPEPCPFWMNAYGKNIPVVEGDSSRILTLGDYLVFLDGKRKAGYCIILGGNIVGFCGLMNEDAPVVGAVPIYDGCPFTGTITCLLNGKPCKVNGRDSFKYEFGKSVEIKELIIK